MAEIPVEKKSSMGWLWALLALLVIGLLIWWLLAEADEPEVADVDTPVVTDIEPVDNDFADVDVAVGPITTVAGLTGLATMVGTDVDLDGVTVTELAGDMAFYIGEGMNRTLVLFDEDYTPGDATEGEYDINVGSRVSLDGEVRAADGTLSDGVFANVPDDTEAYIYADTIEMLN
ncbi:MAG: hypothetical protein V2J26_03075 [Pacificimonas sp.]|jgi:hypothetical protein|nr:hypothetical protein [Pacificimonas sp.]